MFLLLFFIRRRAVRVPGTHKHEGESRYERTVVNNARGCTEVYVSLCTFCGNQLYRFTLGFEIAVL